MKILHPKFLLFVWLKDIDIRKASYFKTFGTFLIGLLGHPNIIHRVDFHDFFTPFTIIVVQSFNKKWSIHFYSPLRRTFDNSVMFCQQLIIWTRASASKLRSFFCANNLLLQNIAIFWMFLLLLRRMTKVLASKKEPPFSSVDIRVNKITDEYSSIKENWLLFFQITKSLTVLG